MPVIQNRTNSDIRLHPVSYAVKHTQAYSFLTVYCMNFIIFLCVTLELFSLSFVPSPYQTLVTPLRLCDVFTVHRVLCCLLSHLFVSVIKSIWLLLNERTY